MKEETGNVLLLCFSLNLSDITLSALSLLYEKAAAKSHSLACSRIQMRKIADFKLGGDGSLHTNKYI
ncbi:hypothetical protein [Paenibacillus sp. J2TS4]|uniref:hypothetical protein n=1 Tax=Paenibacillus sp. J2TS4 TaxID=2807194 RepID=UPI001B119727|nr:hypothetical protein [Paenibacillus sp. J2TS4]GIP33017.1 hypothetical protein J2TS4_22270 [Paenibacillus sp. J2TS4]